MDSTRKQDRLDALQHKLVALENEELVMTRQIHDQAVAVFSQGRSAARNLEQFVRHKDINIVCDILDNKSFLRDRALIGSLRGGLLDPLRRTAAEADLEILKTMLRERHALRQTIKATREATELVVRDEHMQLVRTEYLPSPATPLYEAWYEQGWDRSEPGDAQMPSDDDDPWSRPSR